ncbi:MAG: alkylhydroperoxidase-related (seleno)protein [Myxococcota bacterium]
MSEFHFEQARVPVRADIPEAHAQVWSRIAGPGSWWTGRERVAIAGEVRKALACAFCAERKEALSPNAVSGEHDTTGALPAPLVDAVHRVVTDPARLSKTWFDEVLASELSEGQYVEAMGVVVAVVSMDMLCRGLGIPAEPLPGPAGGEPSRLRPAGAEHDRGFVAMLAPDAVGAENADLYDGGMAANVVRAMSLVPDAVRDLKTLSAAHYLPMGQVGNLEAERAIDRAQIELLAGRVSSLNECFY